MRNVTYQHNRSSKYTVWHMHSHFAQSANELRSRFAAAAAAVRLQWHSSSREPHACVYIKVMEVYKHVQFQSGLHA